jgi:hypothetical protein
MDNTYSDPMDEFEAQVRAVLQTPDPDPRFVRRLEARLAAELEARPRPGRGHFSLGGLTRAGAMVLVVLALASAAAWTVRYLRPGGAGGASEIRLVTATASPTASPTLRPTATAYTLTGTPAGTITPAPYPELTVPPGVEAAGPPLGYPAPDQETQVTPYPLPPTNEVLTTNIPAVTLQPDYRYAQSRLSFTWDGGPEAEFGGPYRGELFAEGERLGRGDFGETAQVGWCDRSWDGQVVAYTYGSELRYLRLPEVEQVYAPLGRNTRLESAQVSVLSPLTFAPGDYRLAFYGCSPQGLCGLYVYALDSGKLQRLSNDDFWQPPAWSPDGSQLAIVLAMAVPEIRQEPVVRVYRSDDGVLLYDGPPDGVDSPILEWGARPDFEFEGAPRCADPPGG